VGYFGVKSTNVCLAQMGTKPAKVGRLASTLLKYTSVLRNEDPPDPPPPRSSLRGRTKVAKVGPLRARVKSAKVRPTPYVYYPGWFLHILARASSFWGPAALNAFDAAPLYKDKGL
jgi:hypothetical protein